MTPDSDASSREKVVFYLKTAGPLTARELAERLGVTAIAVRQHLQGLEAEGLVDRSERRGRVGRPAHEWTLTPAAERRCPDRHRDLLVGLLGAVRQVFGEDGLRDLLKAWTDGEAGRSAAFVSKSDSLATRLEALTALRRDQGYMAECHAADDGTFHFVENHCPIADAARECAGICECELLVLEAILGAEVERIEHIGAGDRRCAYRIGASDGAA